MGEPSTAGRDSLYGVPGEGSCPLAEASGSCAHFSFSEPAGDPCQLCNDNPFFLKAHQISENHRLQQT